MPPGNLAGGPWIANETRGCCSFFATHLRYIIVIVGGTTVSDNLLNSMSSKMWVMFEHGCEILLAHPCSGLKPKEDFKQIRVCFAKKEETLIKAASILNGI